MTKRRLGLNAFLLSTVFIALAMAQLSPAWAQESLVRAKAIQPHLVNLDFEDGATGHFL